METQNVGSDLTNLGMDPRIPFHMVLVKEHTKYELIILTYRIAVIATGIVLVVLGYLLFSNLVIDNDSAQSYYKGLSKLAPGAVFATVGLLFCVSGITKFMPLPKFDSMDGPEEGRGLTSTDVPTLSPLSPPKFTGKLWENNVKPIMEKVANNESISRSDRELLRNWLRSQ